MKSYNPVLHICLSVGLYVILCVIRQGLKRIILEVLKVKAATQKTVLNYCISGLDLVLKIDRLPYASCYYAALVSFSDILMNFHRA